MDEERKRKEGREKEMEGERDGGRERVHYVLYICFTHYHHTADSSSKSFLTQATITHAVATVTASQLSIHCDEYYHNIFSSFIDRSCFLNKCSETSQ